MHKHTLTHKKFIEFNLYTQSGAKLQESFKVTDIDKPSRAHYSDNGKGYYKEGDQRKCLFTSIIVQTATINSNYARNFLTRLPAIARNVVERWPR